MTQHRSKPENLQWAWCFSSKTTTNTHEGIPAAPGYCNMAYITEDAKIRGCCCCCCCCCCRRRRRRRCCCFYGLEKKKRSVKFWFYEFSFDVSKGNRVMMLLCIQNRLCGPCFSIKFHQPLFLRLSIKSTTTKQVIA